MAKTDPENYSHIFYDAQRAGSHSSARVILAQLFSVLGHTPASVADVGCGVGTWLRAALDLGAIEVRGFDGAWVRPADLEISEDCFTPCDLTSMAPGILPRQDGSGKRYELVLSLEVAEHLPAMAAPTLVATLCGLSDIVLFSAAVPYQGGVNHINEAWPGYWAALFREQGFECFDPIRPAVWLRPEVDWWYAQNALVFARGEASDRLRERLAPVADPMPYVHPRKYLLQVAQGRELTDALAAATSPLLAQPPAPNTATEIDRLERTIVLLRAMLEAKGGAPPDAPGSATLGALALYDRARDQAYGLAQEVAQLRLEQLELRERVVALRAEVARAHEEVDGAWRALQTLAGSIAWRATSLLRTTNDACRRLVRLRGSE